MTTKLAKLYKYYLDQEPEFGFLFPPSGVDYPDIEGNLSNFIEDYNDNYEAFDRYFINNFGQRSYNDDIWEPEDMAGVLNDWFDEVGSILLINLDSWARLYYALNEQYNPLYNVDGTTETTFSEKKDTNEYGATSSTDQFGTRTTSETIGAKETTNGARTDNQTSYQVAFDSALEKEVGKNSDSIGSQTINEGSQANSKTETGWTDSHSALKHTDELTSGEHTETTTRFGNQGITMTQQMLEAEWNFRKKAFFKWIMEELSKGVGLYYEF